MAISAQTVKELRDMTGAGMADCKKALEETNGDMQLAIEFLRKRGAASAAKREDRSTNEGLIITKTTPDGKKAAIFQVSCETDFVARNQDFVDFANALGQAVLDHNPADEAAFLAINLGGKTVQDYVNDILAKFNEKIVLKRFECVTAEGFVVDYIHAGNRLGVLLEISGAEYSEANRTIARDIAMQVAAMNPQFVNRSQVDNVTLEKERDIYIEQAIGEGKKPEIAERVANGRLEKFYTENCLVEQTFVKDSSKVITEVLKGISETANVVRFLRYNLGA